MKKMYNLCRVGLKETEYSVSLSMWVVNDGGGGNGSSGIGYSKGVWKGYLFKISKRDFLLIQCL